MAWSPQNISDVCFDVSHNNGKIDWQQIPPEFALVHIKASQGSGFVDPLFQVNASAATERGLMVVPYHFLDASDPTAQFANLMRAVGTLGNLMCPLMLDWEGDPPPPIATMQATGTLCQQHTGRAPLAYHGIYTLSDATINAWPWFVPKYGPPPAVRWLFWQYEATGSIAGVDGNVDRSKFAGTLAELKAWCATGAMPAGF